MLKVKGFSTILDPFIYKQKKFTKDPLKKKKITRNR